MISNPGVTTRYFRDIVDDEGELSGRFPVKPGVSRTCSWFDLIPGNLWSIPNVIRKVKFQFSEPGSSTVGYVAFFYEVKSNLQNLGDSSSQGAEDMKRV
jgi:hypothetical protein